MSAVRFSDPATSYVTRKLSETQNASFRTRDVENVCVKSDFVSFACVLRRKKWNFRETIRFLFGSPPKSRNVKIWAASIVSPFLFMRFSVREFSGKNSNGAYTLCAPYNNYTSQVLRWKGCSVPFVSRQTIQNYTPTSWLHAPVLFLAKMCQQYIIP